MKVCGRGVEIYMHRARGSSEVAKLKSISRQKQYDACCKTQSFDMREGGTGTGDGS